jgi:cell wall assembly regulator SMI1
MPADGLEASLRRLEAAWRRQGAPILEHAAPGLTDAEIDDLMGPLDVELPEELRTWWRWHDGLLGDPAMYDFGASYGLGSVGPGGWQLMSLRDAIVRYQREPREAQWPADPIAGQFFWRDSWFPFARVGSNQDFLFVDTDAGEEPPVRVCFNTDWYEWDVDLAPTLAAAIGIWVRTLEEGYFTWDPVARDWIKRIADLPAELRNSLTC